MEENRDESSTENAAEVVATESSTEKYAAPVTGALDSEAAPATPAEPKHRRQEKVGLVTSDKMQKTVVVRVERQVRHRKYKRYIRRRTKFMAHDEVGAHIGDIVRIVETRPMSARKRWRVVEIVQKAR